MVLINPVLVVFVPFEIRGSISIKRDDLPRFAKTDEVRKYMTDHPEIHRRKGAPVHLQWIEHDEPWAMAEYHRGVGGGLDRRS